MRKLDHGPAAPKIARPSIHPNPSSRFRRTSIAPPTDDSQITQHRIPTLKSDRLLARISHHGHARHRVGRSPIRQKKAAERSLGYAQGPRRRARPARRDPNGGGSRTTGRVKALARCASTHLHDATVRRTALRGRPARRPARRDAGRITSAGQRRRRPRKAALRVAFPVPSGRRERSAMPRHRRHAPDCRGNGKRDPTCRGIVQGSTGIVARTLFLACRPISAVPHLSLVRKPG